MSTSASGSSRASAAPVLHAQSFRSLRLELGGGAARRPGVVARVREPRPVVPRCHSARTGASDAGRDELPREQSHRAGAGRALLVERGQHRSDYYYQYGFDGPFIESIRRSGKASRASTSRRPGSWISSPGSRRSTPESTRSARRTCAATTWAPISRRRSGPSRCGSTARTSRSACSSAVTCGVS